MRIILFGKNGQVGKELYEILKIKCDLHAFDRSSCNFEHLNDLKNIIIKTKPDIIINAAAYTKVDEAENNAELAYKINSDALQAIAIAANEIDALVIHYSTDYVFNGRKRNPYKEKDNVDPLSVYGKSKLSGENRIREYVRRHLIIRTSWVVGPNGKNFVKTIIDLIKNKTEINVVNDQVGAPTSSSFIAASTINIIERYLNDSDNFLFGTYHLSLRGETSWYEISEFIFKYLKKHSDVKSLVKLKKINPVTSSNFPQKAVRPKNSLLDTTSIENVFGIKIPNWKEEIIKILDTIIRR